MSTSSFFVFISYTSGDMALVIEILICNSIFAVSKNLFLPPNVIFIASCSFFSIHESHIAKGVDTGRSDLLLL